jgi:hypothetical protein
LHRGTQVVKAKPNITTIPNAPKETTSRPIIARLALVDFRFVHIALGSIQKANSNLLLDLDWNEFLRPSQGLRIDEQQATWHSA